MSRLDTKSQRDPLNPGESVQVWSAHRVCEEAIPVGTHIHLHNLKKRLHRNLHTGERSCLRQVIRPHCRVFLRSDGRKGIRNCIVVAYLVECAHHVAREIVDAFKGQPVHLIGFGGCYPNAYADRMMNMLCTHPNVGGVLLLSLGCESFNRHRLEQNIEKDRPGRWGRS